MSFDDLQTLVLNAAICVWALAGLFMVVLFGVFSGKPLRKAPARRSFLSLPIVGLVAIVYLATAIFAGMVVAAIANAPGPPGPPGLATHPATVPATALATTTASAPATTQVDAESLLVGQLAGVSAQLLALAPFLLAVPILFPERFRGLGLSARQLKQGLVFGFMAFLTCYGILQITGFLTEVLIDTFRPDRPVDIHPTFVALRQAPPILERIGFFIMAAILAPFSEEVFFRGLFQTTLIQHGWGFIIPQLSPNLAAAPSRVPTALQRLGAIVVVSAVFAGMHQADHFAVLFLLSFALGYIYERTGNLWAPITLHALFNSVMLVPTLVNPGGAG